MSSRNVTSAIPKVSIHTTRLILNSIRKNYCQQTSKKPFILHSPIILDQIESEEEKNLLGKMTFETFVTSFVIGQIKKRQK